MKMNQNRPANHPDRKPTVAHSRIRKMARDWFPSLVLILCVVIARSSLADHYHVPSGSMEPSLMPGDHVMVDKTAYGIRMPITHQVLIAGEQPQRGDVVVFDSPEDPDVRLIKRVVAVAGDTVSVRAGHVFLDGKPTEIMGSPASEQLGETSVALNLSHGGGPDLAAFTIPPGEVLVMGDHRGNSRDGRYFGTIPAGMIYGKAAGVFWRSNAGPLWSPL